MKDFANSYLEKYQALSKWIKVVLCLLWDIPSNLNRFCRSAKNNSLIGMILSVVLAVFGGWVLFVVDALCLALQNKIYWLDDFGFESADNGSGSSADSSEDKD